MGVVAWLDESGGVVEWRGGSGEGSQVERWIWWG